MGRYRVFKGIYLRSQTVRRHMGIHRNQICDAPILGESAGGLCALYDLGQAGITHLKIVGRGNHPDRMVEDIRAMKRALEILDASKDRETYQKRMKQELFLSGCSKNCYYLPANL